MIWSLALPIFYLVWVLVHELSHVGARALVFGVETWEINIIPRRREGGGIMFAHYRATPPMPRVPLRALVNLAPRLPNLAAAVALPLSVGHLPLVLLFGSGLVDLWAGSWGRNERSDLRKAARALDISHWWLRAAGWVTITISLSLTIWLY